MEKILDFKKNEIGIDSKYYRFQCNCLEAKDAMTVGIDACGENNEGKFITICMDLNISFWERVKFLFKGNWNWREFIIRDEDLQPLIDILNPDKKFSELL